MTRKQYLEKVIALYLATPDTPAKARRSDWAVATTFYQQGIPVADIAHALRLCTTRRIMRAPDLPPLERICSLAYIRQTVQGLKRRPDPPDFVDFVGWLYQEKTKDRVKKAGQRRNAAISNRR